jgi:hypothetical protein
MKNPTSGRMTAGIVHFARSENKGSLFPNRVSYNPTNHIGGRSDKTGDWLFLRASRDGNIRGISIILKRKKLDRKTRAIINRLRIYTDMRLKILWPNTAIRIPIKHAKMKETDRQEANRVMIWADTKRRE